MNRKLLITAISIILAPAAYSAPPHFQDTRAMGMGGTGVASARPSGAAQFNPALLTGEHRSGQDRFAATFPSANARFADSEDVPDEIDRIQETIDSLEGNLNQTVPDIESAQSDAGRLADQLEDLDGDTMRVEAGVGFGFARPDREWGVAFQSNAQLRATAQALVSENDIERLREFENASIGDSPSFDTDDLESEGRILASGVLQTGVSFARAFDVQGDTLSIGVTPKYMHLRTFDYVENVDDFDDDDFDASEFETQDNGLNLDLGAVYQFSEFDRWRVGASVRNLVPMNLEARARAGEELADDTPELQIRPQITVGVAHVSDWHTLTADLDLTQQRSFGPEAETQFLSLGGEINVIDWVNLRGGVRQNLASDTGADGIEETTQFTAGFALTPWALRIEAAALVSEDEIGASAELGVAF